MSAKQTVTTWVPPGLAGLRSARPSIPRRTPRRGAACRRPSAPGRSRGSAARPREANRSATSSSLSPGSRNASTNAAAVVAASRAIPSPEDPRDLGDRFARSRPDVEEQAGRLRRLDLLLAEHVVVSGTGSGSPSSRRIRSIWLAGRPVRSLELVGRCSGRRGRARRAAARAGPPRPLPSVPRACSPRATSRSSSRSRDARSSPSSPSSRPALA